MYIVQRKQAEPQDLVRDVQVPEIRPRKAPAGHAIARLVDGPGIGAEIGTLDVEAARARERGSVTAHARGCDAVEKVHAAPYGFDQVLGESTTHEVSWPSRGWLWSQT